MYIWIQLLTAMQLLSINYDENIILSWMKNSMQNAKQNFSTCILVQVSDMLSHYLAVLKRSMDQDLPNSLLGKV